MYNLIVVGEFARIRSRLSAKALTGNRDRPV